ncbi:hypothetical protein CC80DRAFT_541795 [Byssothecium circinans]|uniref:Uncharacterized protein n=1 Tax=Byssothecium circinans TaxID=147558 RepID=A0A6A5UBV1_9PLEO|nr:hypothetical protein CC80DRAFT_541795 [Byssothecium circinans]
MPNRRHSQDAPPIGLHEFEMMRDRDSRYGDVSPPRWDTAEWPRKRSHYDHGDVSPLGMGQFDHPKYDANRQYRRRRPTREELHEERRMREQMMHGHLERGPRHSSRASLHLSHDAFRRFGDRNFRGFHPDYYDDEEEYPPYFASGRGFPGDFEHYGPEDFGNGPRRDWGHFRAPHW